MRVFLKIIGITSVLTIAISIAIAAAVLAAEVVDGPVAATVIEVKDGDTIKVTARIWLGQVITTNVRINGIDTPELRGKCPSEKALAVQARDHLAALTGGPGASIALMKIKNGKFAGRVIANVITARYGDAAGAMIAGGLARAYGGGKRAGWCDP